MYGDIGFNDLGLNDLVVCSRSSEGLYPRVLGRFGKDDFLRCNRVPRSGDRKIEILRALVRPDLPMDGFNSRLLHLPLT